MEANILVGRDRTILEVPEAAWRQHLAQVPQHSQARLNFMTEAHHQIRFFVVKEMLNTQKHVEPEWVAETLKMPLENVNRILEQLERNLFFLVRNAQGAVTWAYPVTVEPTPHRLDFSCGERLYGA